ncbi:DUF262 domain-containing protein [Streptococcus uberis]|uniref:GmrSD restriction endonuclease domain-containing protein n=1 Tax=Streptococcus uberis TaxID=1349 RepID=UPI0012B6719A|nr:DUF262 domain-containing protein [Streptococcus uberis]MTB99884.1 DUF262 domain-containing protein [Streptococcus uberis]
MKISKRILDSVNIDPTRKSHSLSILQICENIDKLVYVLPVYQRDVSWSLKKSIDLLNYQLFGKAAVSPISTNRISNRKKSVPQISFVDRHLIRNEEIHFDQISIVDGQQRLTTNYKAYTNHTDFKNIVLDLQIGKFKESKEELKNSQIPVGILLNRDASELESFISYNSQLQEFTFVILRIRTKMHQYSYTINEASDLSELEQIEWFEVLNNAGSRISKVQMAFSKLRIKDFDIYVEYISPFLEKIEEAGFDELFSVFSTKVSYPICALNSGYEVVINERKHKNNFAPIPSDEKSESISKLDVNDVRKIIDLTLNSLDKTIEFIEKNNLKKNITKMDYILFLIGLFTFKEKVEDEEIVNWVETIDFVNKSNGERREEFKKLISMN